LAKLSNCHARFALAILRNIMKERVKVKERIIENNGKIIAENDNVLKAEFSYGEIEKAVKVYFELTKQLKQDAVLHGGCRLTVYYSKPGTESVH